MVSAWEPWIAAPDNVSQCLRFGSKVGRVRATSQTVARGAADADTAAKLPEIEHVKSRKNGLDVLADIYRYAELGFDAIEPDDLALFRWYGVYTQRAAESAASGEPGPVRGDRRPVHAADQVPERDRHRRADADDRPAGGALRPRDGRHHHASEHPAALAARSRTCRSCSTS